MRLLLVLVALIPCAKGFKLRPAAPYPTRSAQVVCLSPTEVTVMKADLRVAKSTISSLRAEKKSLVKESKAYEKGAKIAEFALIELAKSKEREVQLLIADNDRLQNLAKIRDAVQHQDHI